MPSPTLATLNRVFDQALMFLRASGRDDAIRRQLAALGFGKADHDEGWTLVQKVGAYGGTSPPSTSVNPMVAAAMRAVDDMDADVIERVDAALTRLHPTQAEFFRAGLKAGTGAAAIVSMTTVVTRFRELRSSPERVETRDEDHAALDTLARRGFDEAWLAETEQLVELARSYQAVEDVDVEADTSVEEDLLAVYHWWKDWSRTARAGITKRRWLISLGLAKQRSRKQEEAETLEAETEVAHGETPTE